MFIYILHFIEPLHHAQHYSGSTVDLERRLRQHANGAGSRLTQFLWEEQLEWILGGLYQVNDPERLRECEKLLKSRHSGPKYCRICNPDEPGLKGASCYPLDVIQFPIESQELRK